MIKLASVVLAATLGLSAIGLSKPASAGVVVGVGLPVPAVVPAAAVYPYVYVGGPYCAGWRRGYPYGYWGYGYGWHRGFGWHGGYAGGHWARGWHR